MTTGIPATIKNYISEVKEQTKHKSYCFSSKTTKYLYFYHRKK